MSREKFVVRTALSASLALCALLAAPRPADAGDVKVPGAAEIKKAIARLYNGEVDSDSQSDREKVLLAVEEKLKAHDKQGLALKKPDFWVEAALESRFATGTKRKFGKTKTLTSGDFEVQFRDDKPDAKPHKAKLYWRGGGLVVPAKAAPLLVCVLDKDTDPEAYLKTNWPDTIDEIAKQWIVVAVQDSPEFPISRDPALIARAFLAVRDLFATDANRWFLEAVGGATQPVQRWVSQGASTRLAGLILRGPASAITTVNSALAPTLVVHGATSAPGKMVAEAYKKLDDKQNSSIEVADLPAVNTFNEQVVSWLLGRQKRTVPASSTFVTTITDNDGEAWTGCLRIESVGKRGHPTSVTVNFIRDTNTVDIKCENLGEFYLYMNDDLLDLDKEVSIFVNGNGVAKKVFERNLRAMLETADQFGEWGRMFPAYYRGVVKNEIPKDTPAPPAPDKPADPEKPAPTDKPPAGGDAPTPPK